ncbi:MAG: hypothetical protein HFJ27_02265 [Clostridia bacterium]|nr:hypothetical protein [Clostridia bacterium]
MKIVIKFIAFFVYTIAIFYINDIRILVSLLAVQIILARIMPYFICKCDKNNMEFNAIYPIYGVN